MAPQQNSTLIDDNLDSCPSLLNLPEELNRYSPILPPKTQGKNSNTNVNSNNKNRNENNSSQNHNAGYKYNSNQNVILHNPQTHRQHNKYKHQQQQQEHHQQHHHHPHNYRSGSSHVGHSRRSRSISLHGVNSTVEQGNKEIPIWIGDDEPRYVSGVTRKTTCYDIIKALIDDEIHNGNYAYCRGRRTRKTGMDGAASRDYSDYVITETWRGIERSYNGNMAILPVWKAWSHVHNEIRLSLRHFEDIEDPPRKPKKNKNLSSLLKYLRKLLHFAKNKKEPRTTENYILCNEDTRNPDEILFVLLPDNKYDKSKNNHEKNSYRTKNLEIFNEELEKKIENKLLKERLYRLSETRASIRKRQRSTSTVRRTNKNDLEKQRRSSFGKNNCVRRRKDVPIRSSIRHELAKKTSEMDELYDREYGLTKKLTSKCKMYKEQNELYTTSEKHLEISIGQIQRNVEEYAEEIIQTEHELLELKNEIKQDISIINNLKRMTLEANETKCGIPEVQAASHPIQTAQAVKENAPGVKLVEQMQFVDNIYEFCDNNASILV